MLNTKLKSKAIDAVQVHDTDTGSPEVQVSIASKRIEELSGHLKTHPKDNHSRRGLLGLVSKRQSLLKYLKKKSPERYETVTTKLGLKKK